MPLSVPAHRIAAGVTYTGLTVPHLRTGLLRLHFYCPHSDRTAGLHELLTELIPQTSAAYPTVRDMTRRLTSLYDTAFYADIEHFGDWDDLCFTLSWLDDRFTGGESAAAQALDILRGCILHPLLENGAFPSDLFEIARENLLGDIDCEADDRRGYARTQADAMSYAGQPAAIPPLGTRDAAAQADSAAAYAAWQNLLQNAPAAVICVQPAENPLPEETVTAVFAEIARTEPAAFTVISPADPKQHPCMAEENVCAAQTRLVMNLRDTGSDSDAAMLLNELLGAMPDSLLLRNVRERYGQCYYCETGYSRCKQMLTIETATADAQLAQTRAAILHELDVLRSGDVSQRALQAAKLHFAFEAAQCADSPEGLAEWLSDRALFHDERTPQQLCADMEQVTAERIAQAARALVFDAQFTLHGIGEEAET
ncbi:MAG TPA: hypothetical protein DDX71_03415 [Ruminococcus sp.]|nr:hypothetical protein [Ruminococcus sp.]